MTPVLSAALAFTLTVAATVALLAGAVRLTVGGTLSGAATVKVMPKSEVVGLVEVSWQRT